MTENLRNGSVVKEIQALVAQLKNSELKIEALENEVKELKAQKKELEEVTIPDVMQEAGVNGLTLMTGDIVTVKPFYYARLFQEGNEPFFKWLRENNFGGLIKEKVDVLPGPELIQLVLDFLAEFHVYYEQHSTVHWKTLEAWFKECCEAGVKGLPLDLFQNYTGRKAKITSK